MAGEIQRQECEMSRSLWKRHFSYISKELHHEKCEGLYMSAELFNVNKMVSESADFPKQTAWTKLLQNHQGTLDISSFSQKDDTEPWLPFWMSLSIATKESLQHSILFYTSQLPDNLWNIYDPWFHCVSWILEVLMAISTKNEFFCCVWSYDWVDQ